MRQRWILASLTLCCLAAPVRASLLVDPFVEDFRVGQEALLDTPDSRGWPAGLDTPAHWSAGWMHALARVRPLERAHDPRLLAWRFGDAPLAALLVDPEGPGGAWLERPRRVLDALAARAAGSNALAVRLAGRLAEDPAEGDWTPEERFIWRLRQLSWSEAPLPAAPWPELLDLPSSDRRAGWRIWMQRCATTGRNPLAGLDGSLRWARWLADVGDAELTSSDLAAVFPPSILSGLGAALLRGDALNAHLSRYPDIPTDPTVQDWWLQGLWRRDAFSAAAARRLADLEGVTPANRAAFLRRAADKDFTRGRWDTGLPALEESLRIAVELDDRRLLERVRHELARATVKAETDRRNDLVERLNALRDSTEQSRGTLVDGFRDRVRSGGSPDFDDRAAGDLSAAATGGELLSWRLWDRIGTQHGVAACLVGVPDDLAALRDAAAQVLAQRLAAGGDLDVLRRWALLLDASTVSPEPLPFQSSPLPDLARAAHAAGDRARLHALWGAAFLLRDPRGQLAAWILLPASDLDDAERLLLNHPLPADPQLLAELEGAGAPPEVLLAIARNESLFDPAVRSFAGALGWMQIMPFHYPGRGHQDGEVLWRRRDLSLKAGARILSRDGRRYDADPYRTLAAYNGGPGAVDRWNGQIGASADRATFLSWIGYPSTRRYVEKVLIDRLAYRWLFGHLSPPERTRQDPDGSR